MRSNLTQLTQVRNHLKIFGSLTSWDAIQKYRITRLSHYILKLRKELLADPKSTKEIISVIKKGNGKWWTEYQFKDKTNESN